MHMLAQILAVISFFSFALYNYLDNLNDLTRLRLSVPHLQRTLNQEIVEYQQLRDQWTRMTRPQALYELQKKPGFRHLRVYQTPKNLPPTP